MNFPASRHKVPLRFSNYNYGYHLGGFFAHRSLPGLTRFSKGSIGIAEKSLLDRYNGGFNHNVNCCIMPCVDGSYCVLKDCGAKDFEGLYCHLCPNFLNFYVSKLPKVRLGQVERGILLNGNPRSSAQLITESQKVAYRRALSKLTKCGLIIKYYERIKTTIKTPKHWYSQTETIESKKLKAIPILTVLAQALVVITREKLLTGKRIRWSEVIPLTPLIGAIYQHSLPELKQLWIETTKGTIILYQQDYDYTNPKIQQKIKQLEKDIEKIESINMEGSLFFPINHQVLRVTSPLSDYIE